MDSIDNLDNNEEIGNSNTYSTIFEYTYDDSESRISKDEFQRACKEAYTDWEVTIPFVLAFSDKLGTIIFNNVTVKKELLKEVSGYKNFQINYIDKQNTLLESKKVMIKYEGSRG